MWTPNLPNDCPCSGRKLSGRPTDTCTAPPISAPTATGNSPSPRPGAALEDTGVVCKIAFIEDAASGFYLTRDEACPYPLDGGSGGIAADIRPAGAFRVRPRAAAVRRCAAHPAIPRHAMGLADGRRSQHTGALFLPETGVQPCRGRQGDRARNRPASRHRPVTQDLTILRSRPAGTTGPRWGLC